MKKILLYLVLCSGVILAFLLYQSRRAEFRLDCFENLSPTENLTVLIPGSKEKIPPVFKDAAARFYRNYGVEPGEETWMVALKDFLLARSDADVCLFEWPGGITEAFSLRPAAKKLAEYLKEKEYADIVLFGKSLGGNVGEMAIRNSPSPEPISKLIYVATPHRSVRIDLSGHVEMINIYSEADRYLDLAKNVLYFGQGVLRLENAENIILPGLRHSQFNANIAVKLENEEKNIFEIYLAQIEK